MRRWCDAALPVQAPASVGGTPVNLLCGVRCSQGLTFPGTAPLPVGHDMGLAWLKLRFARGCELGRVFLQRYRHCHTLEPPSTGEATRSRVRGSPNILTVNLS